MMSDAVTHLWQASRDALTRGIGQTLSRERLQAGLVPFKHDEFFARMQADTRLQNLNHGDMLAAFTGVVNDRVTMFHGAAQEPLAANVVAFRRIDLNDISAEEILGLYQLTHLCVTEQHAQESIKQGHPG